MAEEVWCVLAGGVAGHTCRLEDQPLCLEANNKWWQEES